MALKTVWPTHPKDDQGKDVRLGNHYWLKYRTGFEDIDEFGGHVTGISHVSHLKEVWIQLDYLNLVIRPEDLLTSK